MTTLPAEVRAVRKKTLVKAPGVGVDFELIALFEKPVPRLLTATQLAFASGFGESVLSRAGC